MTAVYRLDSASPELADAFRRAPPATRRHAALVACERAAHAARLEGRDVAAVLEALRRGAGATPELRRRLEALAASFDEEYFGHAEAPDGSKTAEAMARFFKARAASALAQALASDDGDLHEAIYEASAASEHPDELLQVVAEVFADFPRSEGDSDQ
jgi:hypothetical protein